MNVKKYIGYALYSCLGGLLPHGTTKQFKLSNAIRKLCGKLMFDYTGKNVNIGRKIRFSKQVSLGSNSSIGDNAYISGELQIGDNVMIAPKCSFIAIEHEFDKDNPCVHVGNVGKKICIKDNAWIGYGAIILAGVTVGEGGVVGAGAVVTKDVEPYSVVGGVPAKKIKMRV